MAGPTLAIAARLGLNREDADAFPVQSVESPDIQDGIDHADHLDVPFGRRL